MSDSTTVRVWPCATEAIDWSHDGIIALAANDNVELLFPNSDLNEMEWKATSWQHFPLQVSWFTSQELPPIEPAPGPIYSVGEEISTNSTVSIAWSPPGLAKHRRCALGVLTSSLVLSIWSTDESPRNPRSWKRRLIVNDALSTYYKNEMVHEWSEASSQNGEEEKIEEFARLRSRARVFTWAPAFPDAEYSGIVGTVSNWGQHIIAVANDDNQIALMIVESPASTLGTEETWNAEVLNHFTIMPDSESVSTVPNTFDEIMKQQRCISHIAWSPWTLKGDRFHSVLAYASNDDVRLRIITYTHGTIGLGDEVVYSHTSLRHKGPLKWSPRIIDGDKLRLALFGTDGLSVLTVSMSDASIVDRKLHKLDERWDDISGVVWDDTESAPTHLHFGSVHSTLSCPTATVEVTDSELIGLPSPNWREQISDSQALFSAQNDLKGNVRSKVWGLCSSPLGNLIATCHTVHPSDMLEYGAPNQRHCAVAINTLKSYTKNQLLQSPTNSVSVESIVIALRKWIQNTVEDLDRVSVFAEEVLNKMMQIYCPVQEKESSSSHDRYQDASDITELASSFKRNVFLNANTLEDRYTILTNHICSLEASSNTLPKALIAYRLASATINTIPTRLTHITSFSREILASHQQLVALINTVMRQSARSDDDATSTTTAIPSHPEPDTCDFCEAIIPFTDLDTATCTNGHEFPRCGLTFLAIQAPRISKYCGVCGAVFFSDEFVAAQELPSDSSDDELEDVQRQTHNLVGANAGKERTSEDDEAYANGTGGRSGGGKAAAEPSKRREQSNHDEETLARAMKRGEERVAEDLPVSFARILFLACDVCIYCGGKYVG